MQDPDLENARFEILDFSCSGPKSPRRLTLIDAKDIPRIDEPRKVAMLAAFAEGYFTALAELARQRPADNAQRRGDEPGPDPSQPGLFD
ncbi:hypothetical protein D3C72_1827920 [compost metagenome]